MLFNKNTKRQRASFIFNIVIAISVVFGAALKYIWLAAEGTPANGILWSDLKYFTWQSNIIMGIVALVYAIYLGLQAKGKVKTLPKPLECIKLYATAYVALTNITVLFFLTPTTATLDTVYPAEDLYLSSNIFYHMLVPIMSVLTWMLFERTNKIKFRDLWYVFIYFGIYLIVYAAVAYSHINADQTIDVKYDWYSFCGFNIWLGPVFMVVMSAAMFGITYGLWVANRHINIYPSNKKTQGK